jgi:hypothetical protein
MTRQPVQVSSCGLCLSDVIDAQGPGGTRIVLHPKPAPGTGAYGARWDGARWLARPLERGRTLIAGENRYAAHKCAGRGGQVQAWRDARSALSRAQRAGRGRYQPRTGLAATAGIRVPPPGERRTA